MVNATSIGLSPHTGGRLNIDLDRLLPGMVVADIIPNPRLTTFLKSARQRIKLWTGVDADPPVMRRTLEELFETSAG